MTTAGPALLGTDNPSFQDLIPKESAAPRFDFENLENSGAYCVHAELPGVKPEDVKVEVSEDSLIIQGATDSAQQSDGVAHHTHNEIYRRIPLPFGFNPEQIRATFHDGKLDVTVPVPEPQSFRRQIPVEIPTINS